MRLFRRFTGSLLFLVCLLALSLAFRAGATESGTGDTADLVIFYTSDAHGYIVSDERAIGLDRVAAIKNSVPGSLLVDAGDFLHGQPLATLSQGRDVVRLMKKAGYFAAAAGNHEFAYLLEVLKKRSREAQAPPDSMVILSANVRQEDGSLLLPPEASLDLRGVRVCLFGLTTNTTPSQARASSVRGLRFDDPIATAKDVSQAQRARGCQVIVALSHLGSDPAYPDNSRELAVRAPAVDVIIDGHSHKVVDEKIGPARVLVSPGAHGEHVGRLDIRYDREGGRITDISNTLLDVRDAGAWPPEPALEAELTAMRNALDERLSLVVGNVRSELPGGHRAARDRETALGCFSADALRAAYGDDFALVNGGGLRAGIQKGEVTRGQILAALPFNDLVISLEVTGQEMLDLLEHGFSYLPAKNGAFPQLSGLSVRLKADNPPGKRVLSATLADGSPLDPGRSYTLSTNAFLADGGDGYPHLAAKAKRKSFMFVDEALIQFIQRHDSSGYVDGKATRIFFE